MAGDDWAVLTGRFISIVAGVMGVSYGYKWMTQRSPNANQ